MRKWFLSILIFYSYAYAQNVDLQINQIINNNPNIKIGILVFDLNSNKILFKKNENELFVPASNMKLFSDAAALFALGANHHFITQLTTDKLNIENRTLKNSVYLELSGDPSFNKENLKALLYSLKAHNIDKIDGNFIIISKNQNLSPYGPGWLTEDYKYDYAAPLGPIILNENRITFSVKPTKTGAKAIVKLSEPNSVKVSNEVITKNDNNCKIHFDIDENNNLSVNGCIKPQYNTYKRRIAVRNPTLYSKKIIEQLLKEVNIQLAGSIKYGTETTNEKVVFHKVYSPSLSELIKSTLKPSDNLYAESLYLNTAAVLTNSELNWENAKNSIKDYISKQTGINLNKAVIVDGSGLSRHNMITPLQTVNLLKYIYYSFPYAFEYIAALPISGIDGTLEQRLKNYKGLIRAKTGAMKGVLSLSGFLQTRNYHTLIFAIFINSTEENTDLTPQEKNIVDKICERLVEL